MYTPYIVAWVYNHPPIKGLRQPDTDHWEVRETKEEAEALYNEVIDNGAVTASILLPIQSTDYDPVQDMHPDNFHASKPI